MDKQLLLANINNLPISKEAKSELPLFIRELSGPENLRGLVLAAEGYMNMYAEGGFNGIESTDFKFGDLCNEIISKREELSNFSRWVGCEAELSANQIIKKKLLTANPLYSIMIYGYTEEEVKLNLLRQALYVSYQMYLTGHYAFIENDFYDFSLLIRKMTDCLTGQNWLKKVDSGQLTSFESIVSELGNIQSHPDGNRRDKYLIDQIRKCQNFFNAACGLPTSRKETSMRSTSTRSQSSNKTWLYEHQNETEDLIVIVEGDRDDPDQTPKIWGIRKKADEKLKQQYEEFGLEPEEIPEKDEHYIFVADESGSEAGKNFQISKKRQQILNAVEKSNQNLPYMNTNLTDQEVYKLFQWIHSRNNRTEKLQGLVLNVVFSLSVSMERALNIQFIRTNERHRHNKVGDNVFYDIDTNTWLLNPLDFKYQTENIEGAEKESIPVNNTYIELPDVFGFCSQIKDLYEDVPPRFPFSGAFKLDLDVKRSLRIIDRELTFSKIQNVILKKLASEVDPAMATLITGTPLYTASATKYYTTLSTEEIKEYYLKVTSHFSNLLGYNQNYDQDLLSIGYLGARYTPTTEHVKSVILNLKNHINYIRSNKESDWWVEFHNWYTAYCIYSQILITGLRAVKNPLLESKEFIKSGGLAIFRDKDGEDEYQTRNIPCHPLAKQITVLYESHLRKIKKRLDGDEYQDLKVFLLDGEKNLIEASPKNIKKWLGKYTCLPLNSNRKYLRRYLIETAISISTINTFLGHGSRGEKYSERYLSKEFKSVFKEIHTAMDKLILKLDIEPIRGLLR